MSPKHRYAQSTPFTNIPDMNDLDASLCGSAGNMPAPARHASRPMQPAEDMPLGMNQNELMNHNTRAYSPSMHIESKMPAPAADRQAMPSVIYVTETRTECSCKSTSGPSSMHISQIPVHVPASSSMGAMLAASSPVMSNGIMVGASSSSVVFGSQMSAATPTPSGASASRFNAFQGAAPLVNAAQSGAAALVVAALMGLMIAL